MKTVFDEFTVEARRVFEANKETVSFKRGQEIYRAGDQPQGIYLIQAGLVGLFHRSAKGTDHLLRLFNSGQFFAHRSYFAMEPHHATAIALDATRVSFVRKSAVEEVLRLDPGILRHIARYLARELGVAELQRVMVSEQDVLTRTAHAVAVMKDFSPDHRWTRAEIASFCGSTTPTVVRALAELESRGLILQTGREIRVLDREGLLRFESLET